MTTAHRPTFYAARAVSGDKGYFATGGTSRQHCVRDIPHHMTLKMRKPEQMKAALTREMMDANEDKAEAAEKAKADPKLLTAFASTGGASGERGVGGSGLRLLTAGSSGSAASASAAAAAAGDDPDLGVAAKYDDADDDDEDDDSDLDSSDSDSDDDDLDSDSDDDDDEAALQLELEKIKREREEARLKVETERLDDEAAAAAEAATTGNPLLLGSSAQVKRKWNDDVVFRNQARDGGAAAQPTKKRFVNDTVRNDFHKRFLGKYIR